MIKTVVICDECGDICKKKYLTIYKNNAEGRAIGKFDICEVCYKIMLEALEKELRGEK